MKTAIKNKYVFTALLLILLAAAGIGLTELYVRFERGAEPESGFHVVTSFYPVYIAAENIIGDVGGVSLANLSEPQTGCLHDYQLTTEDMRKLSAADVFLINGGGMEHFLSEVAGRYPSLTVVNASEQIDLLADNAHAWMSIPDYMVQVQTIADGLSELYESHRKEYEANCGRYMQQLKQLLKKQQAVREQIPQSVPRRSVLFHEAFAYLARDFGLQAAGSLDLDEERQVSAGEVAQVVRLVKEQAVPFILAEEQYGKQMCETVQKEADVQAVYLDPCVQGDGRADSYVRAMRENIRVLQEAFAKLK